MQQQERDKVQQQQTSVGFNLFCLEISKKIVPQSQEFFTNSTAPSPLQGFPLSSVPTTSPLCWMCGEITQPGLVSTSTPSTYTSLSGCRPSLSGERTSATGSPSQSLSLITNRTLIPQVQVSAVRFLLFSLRPLSIPQARVGGPRGDCDVLAGAKWISRHRLNRLKSSSHILLIEREK